jgi:hypothetical protein
MEKAGYQIRDQSKPHFMTFTIEDWIDIFTRKIYRKIGFTKQNNIILINEW